MEIEKLINDVNKRIDKDLSIYQMNSTILKIENHLIYRIRRYIVDIERLQDELFNYKQTKKGKFIEIHNHTLIACVIGAKYGQVGSFGTSLGFLKYYSVFILLSNKLKKLGQIGTKSLKRDLNGRSNYVGKCAEIKVSYQLYNKIKIANLKDIEFTNAYRPRTLQIIDRCESCKFIFGDV